MGEILFTMRDIESDWASFAEGDKEKFGLGKLALAAGGLAGTAGLAALAIKNRQGIGQVAGKVGQQIGGYWRKTKSGGKSFVKDARVGSNTPSMSNNVNRGGAAASEIQGNLAPLKRQAAPESVIPAGARKTAAPDNVIPAELRKSKEIPEYLRAMRKPAGPGFNRSRRILANFGRYQ